MATTSLTPELMLSSLLEDHKFFLDVADSKRLISRKVMGATGTGGLGLILTSRSLRVSLICPVCYEILLFLLV